MSKGELRAERARGILEFCRHGLVQLWQNPTGYDWIIQWAGTLALLRTVGDALEKVDAKIDSRFGVAQADWWKRTKSGAPPIYFEFICRDRNLLLHEAKVNAGQSAMVHLQGVAAVASVVGFAPGASSLPKPPQLPQPLIPAKYSYHINSGPFAGRDPRELVEEAVTWWEQQIMDIERDAAAR